MKNLLLALSALLFVMPLAACGGTAKQQIPATPKNVVIISGNLQTSATKTMPDSAITQLARYLMGGGEISVIVPGSRPRLTKLDPITRPQNALDEAWQNYLNLLFRGDDQTAGLKDQIEQATPKKAGYNLCEAFALSARQSPDEIIVLGSGLPTDGALNFTEGNLLLADDEQVALIAEKLADGRYFPDLTGVGITWYGLGETAGEQQPLTNQTYAALEDLWRAIIEEAGGRVTFYPANVTADVDLSTYPFVPSVEIPIGMNDLEDIYDYEEIVEPVYEEVIQPVRLNDTGLNFVAGEDAFINPEDAQAALAPIASGLIKSGQSVYILGMTAITSDGPPALDDLSLRRAAAIRDVLVTLGVPETQIHCVGTGSLPNVFRTEPDTIGSAANRVAILIDAADERILHILTGKKGADYYED